MDEFQSTRPMRGATLCDLSDGAAAGVSIHAPHAGRDSGSGDALVAMAVSIHAPHAGRDTI